MGMPTMQTQQPMRQSSGKGMGQQAPMTMDMPSPTDGGPSQMTYSGQNGQPRFGQPNSYSNTVKPWDNATIAPQYSSGKGGKTGQTATQQPIGKGGSQMGNYPVARTNFTYNPVTTPLQNTAATQTSTNNQQSQTSTNNQQSQVGQTWSGY